MWGVRGVRCVNKILHPEEKMIYWRAQTSEISSSENGSCLSV